MEKRKRIEAESQLPEAIIQHIQSFLDGKEAAQTTLLSRSWYNAWLTRPNLDFDSIAFKYKPDSEFWEFVNKTMERYEKLNLKIDSLRLWISVENPLVNELIIKALKMGATALDFKIYALNEFALSNQVFGFKSLTRLSLKWCRIADHEKLPISCSKLKSLSLDSQSNVIWDIISSCPLIENFSLSSPADSGPWTEFGNRIVNEFHKLKHLLLYRVRVHASCFDDFSCKFPCLKDLALRDCHGGSTDTHISSPSLECINFTGYTTMRRAKFDVPRIRKFTFSGSNIPRLSFKTTTLTSNCNWESDISIERRCPPNAAWFLSLSRLLKKLSLSKVSLSLKISSPSECAGKFQGLRNKPRVENLKITGPYSVCPALFYYLFKCCRPIYVAHYWFPKSCRDGKKQFDFMEFVSKRMMQQVSLNSCIAYQRMCADLEEVSVEFYDESVSAWRTSTSPGADDEHKIRLHLRWGN